MRAQQTQLMSDHLEITRLARRQVPLEECNPQLRVRPLESVHYIISITLDADPWMVYEYYGRARHYMIIGSSP